jgi:hypothetical protein
MANYMVLFVSVDKGLVDGVYEADELGVVGRVAEEVNEKKQPFKIPGLFVSADAIPILEVSSNPTCRYVHRSDCRYVRVCK